MLISLTNQSKEHYLQGIREIFFASSTVTTFETEDKREAFFHRWTDYYFNQELSNIWLYLSNKDDVLGYLMGCEDSLQAQAAIQPHIPSYGLFSDLFERFPRHLHINCHPQARGKGIGRDLMNHFFSSGSKKSIHIVTSPTSRNVRFYDGLGFKYTNERLWKNRPLLFMGRESQ